MDTWITILFFIIAAIVSAFLKKKQPDAGEEERWGDGASPSSPADRGSPPPARRESWEDELRRLLEGKTGQEPVSPPPPPPPLPVAPPPPILRSKPPRSSSPFPASSSSTGTTEPARKLRETRKTASTRLQKAMDHLREASQLDDRAARTIRNAADRIHLHVEKKVVEKSSPEIKNALALLKSRESLRSAMIASIVLGPPKSVEFESGKNS